ncbi:response regulator [Fulvivirga maritima]|uniref:response regulator n=1 Tax=Fulvivirga maritima TaxID=2904247 RepID=UPI001F36317B|nr:response regulator [Fulvivirga maritima]UII24977.1 response regulator [Fulvivirga maritima]
MAAKILVYDDDEDILEICKYILESRGYEVFTRQTCGQVLSDLKEVRPDAVIMDNWIPTIGGVRATQLIKQDEEFFKTPVLLFTASKNAQSLAIEGGADDYIEKPFSLKDMEEAVKKLLSAAN